MFSCLKSKPTPPEANTIVQKYRKAITKKKATDIVLWGKSTVDTRQILLDAAASVDKTIAQDAALNHVLNGGGSLEKISTAIEALLIERAAGRDAVAASRQSKAPNHT